jgi:hypothetical protein
MSIKQNRVDVVETLLIVDINLINTPHLLHVAIKENASTHLIEMLIRHGADLQSQDEEGNTPLHVSFELKRANVIALLLEEGACLAIKNQKEQTPICNVEYKLLGESLLEAFLAGQYGAVRQFLNLYHAFDVNEHTTPNSNMTALHLAVAQRAPLDLVHLLLQKGALPSAVDTAGHTPLSMALEREVFSMVRILEKPATFVIDVQAFREFMMLYHLGHWAISYLPLEIIDIIVENLGYTPHFAEQLMQSALKCAESVAFRFTRLATEELGNKEKTFYWLMNEYGAVPMAVEAALRILNSMQKLSSLSSVDAIISLSKKSKQRRINEILRLSRLLIYRGVSSPLAYRMRGIYGPNGGKYLALAEMLDPAILCLEEDEGF